MIYNFDEIIDRRGSNCLKYDFAKERGKSDELLPMWIADMDFKAAPEISKALQKLIDHGVYGYTDTKSDYFEAVYNWFHSRHQYELCEEALIKAPSIVYAIAAAVQTFTSKGDAIIIQTPVYYPFYDAILRNDRKLVENPLYIENGKYRIDFDDFEKKIVSENVKMFILCSPHNPVSRVWTKEEMLKLGNICLKYKVLVFSDEIHCDFVYGTNKHFVFPSLSKEFEDNTILATSASKSFSLAGLHNCNIFIKNKELKKLYQSTIEKAGYSQPNMMGIAATKAAYKSGGAWFDDLLVYLNENIAFMREFIQKNMPKIHMIEPEGTYLIWVDMRELGLDDAKRDEFIEKKAKLWLNKGSIFGKASRGFERFNIACPKATLKEAMERLKKAYDELES